MSPTLSMTARRPSLIALAACLALGPAAHADDLRTVKAGEPVPAFRLAAIDGSTVDSAAMKGSALVVVYLSAEQRSSELAASDAAAVMAELKDQPARLVFVTADAVSKAYFEKFRQDHRIAEPLAFDADRSLYHALGMIVFPTTVITDKDGRLAHVISLRGPDYPRRLDAYVRHALGQLTDDQTQERLRAAGAPESAPRSLAAAHRAAARLLREKGRLDAAREELAKARAADPDDHEARLDLAEVDLATGNLDEASSLVDELIKAQPEHRRARQLKGVCLYRQGKLPEAEATLLEALKLNPEPGRVHFYLGRIYERTNQPTKAMEHYREALRRAFNEPDEPAAPRN